VYTLSQYLGGGNRIVACNPCHRLIYIFSIFNIPTDLPTNSLALIGCYWIVLEAKYDRLLLDKKDFYELLLRKYAA